MDTPDLSQHIWNEQNLAEYRNSLKNAPSNTDHLTRKLFYIEPKGTLLQNELLIGLVVNYKGYNVKENTLLEVLLSHGVPVLRATCMSETAPRSGEFAPVTFDLIEEIIKRKDKSLLQKLYQYIDLSDYEDFAEEIAALIGD